MPDGPIRGRDRLLTFFWIRVPSDITIPEGPLRRTDTVGAASNCTFTPSWLTIPEGPTTAALSFSSLVSVARTAGSGSTTGATGTSLG